jgi:hypothetical protein
MILQGFKPRIFKRLDKFRARWVAELPSVLWSLRTTPRRAMGFTPFFMVHGSEAVLPTNIDYGSPRLRAYTEEGNQVALEDAIDQLDEARDVALLRCAKYQQALKRYHERNVRPREFHVGDLAPTSSRQQGQAQAITTLGGAVHHPRGALGRDIQDPVRG